eukprot:scaffold114875_cov31-Attheya_sp.AAC.2
MFHNLGAEDGCLLFNSSLRTKVLPQTHFNLAHLSPLPRYDTIICKIDQGSNRKKEMHPPRSQCERYLHHDNVQFLVGILTIAIGWRPRPWC